MKDSAHTIIYATVLGLVCSLLLTGVAEMTSTARESNREAERMRHIFGVLGVEYAQGATSRDLVDLYKETVEEKKLGELTLYVYAPDNVDASKHATAVLFSGPGLWGPVKGFLALDAELKTIRGITFHVQEETPGLGGEIAAECTCDGTNSKCPAWFRHQFIGKRIEDEARGLQGITIVHGKKAVRINEVDAISGATMTCNKVEDMLNAVIGKIIKERDSNGR